MNISIKIGKRQKNTSNQTSPSIIGKLVSKSKELALVPVPICTGVTKIVASTVVASLEPLKINVNVNSNENTPEEIRVFENESQNEVPSSIAWNFRNDVAEKDIEKTKVKYLPTHQSQVSMSSGITPIRVAPPPPQNSSGFIANCDPVPVSGSTIDTPPIPSRTYKKKLDFSQQNSDNPQEDVYYDEVLKNSRKTILEPLIKLDVPFLQVSVCKEKDARSELKPTPAPRNVIQNTVSESKLQKVELPSSQNALEPLNFHAHVDQELMQASVTKVPELVPASSLPPLSPRPRRMNIRILQPQQESFTPDVITEDIPPPIPPRPKRHNY